MQTPRCEHGDGAECQTAKPETISRRCETGLSSSAGLSTDLEVG